MDATAVDALQAIVDVDVYDPERFFRLLHYSLEELERLPGRVTLDAFIARFRTEEESEGFGWPAERFIQHIEYADDGIEVVRAVFHESLDELVATFTAMVDERWLLFLDEVAAHWDGRDESWPEFASYFMNDAESVGLLTRAAEFIETSSAMDGAEQKIELFANYGVAIRIAGQYDDDTWRTFLVELSKFWNGHIETWDQFVTYFLYYAEDWGVTRPAAELIEVASAFDDAAGKMDVFRGYGIDIEVAPLEGGGEDEEEAWGTFLLDLAPYWNGRNETWDEFASYFLYQAEQLHSRPLMDRATELVYAASSMDDAEGRIDVFANYGVTIEQDGDPGDFYDFLADYGGTWDGLEAHWDDFRKYFLHWARERGVGKPATLFVDEAEREGELKGEFFRTYQVELSPVAPEFVPIAVSEAVDGAPDIPAADVEVYSEAFAELIELMPEVARMTPPEIRQLIVDVSQREAA